MIKIIAGGWAGGARGPLAAASCDGTPVRSAGARGCEGGLHGMAEGARAAITRDCNAQTCSYIQIENYNISGEQCQKRAAIKQSKQGKPSPDLSACGSAARLGHVAPADRNI